MSKRKFSTDYIKCGFIATIFNIVDNSLPQCMICMKALSNVALKPSLLKRHLESNHAEKMNRDILSDLGEHEATVHGSHRPVLPK